MEHWITEHAPTLLSILGGLYIAARGIVAITPTPRDDRWLSSTQRIVRSLASLFGLNPAQGRTDS